ncbi:MAG: hypothetical protein R3Y10_00900 [Ferrimonas sp.]
MLCCTATTADIRPQETQANRPQNTSVWLQSSSTNKAQKSQAHLPLWSQQWLQYATLLPVPLPSNNAVVTPPLLLPKRDAYALYFDGQYGLTLPDWQPQGQYRVIAWLQQLADDPKTTTYLLRGHSGDYLAFSAHSASARWGNHTIHIPDKFQFDATNYVEFTVTKGQLTVSDGHQTEQRHHPTIHANSTVFHQAYQNSQGALQTLGLIDYQQDKASRSYQFGPNGSIIESSSAPTASSELQRLNPNLSTKPLSTTVRTPTPLIHNQAQWDTQFAQLHPQQRPLLASTHGNDHKKFAWEGHYWLRAYLTMAQTYQDDKYLEYAIELIDHMFHYTDEARAARGELQLSQAPYALAPKAYLLNPTLAAPGWRQPYYNGEWRIEVLSDGQILNAITRVADHLLHHQNPRYQDHGRRYLAQAQTIIESHRSSYSNTKQAQIPGSYFYVNPHNAQTNDAGLFSNPVPHNHNLTMGVALIFIDKWHKTAHFRQQILELHQFFSKQLHMNDDGSCRWHYAWDKDGNTKWEDANHGHLDVGFMVTAFNEGYVSDSKTLQCLAKTLTQTLFVPPGMLHYDVQGHGLSSRWDQLASGYDWVQLIPFEPSILAINHHILRHYGQPNWSRSLHAWANLLYWRSQSLPLKQ